MKSDIEIIAEIGSNWFAPGKNGLERAIALIKSAADNGADVAKFQLFRAESLYRDKDKQAGVKHLELPLEWIPQLKKVCDDNEIEFLLSVFYPEAVNQVKGYVQRWKIASWDMTYIPLLEAIGKTKMPVIMSTGAAGLDEVENSLEVLIENGTGYENITLLHCTGGYPTQPRDMVMNRINDLAAEFFPCYVGLSSHCVVPAVTASAVWYGAKVIEVHYDFGDGLGAEAGHSYNPKTLAEMIKLAKMFEEAKDCGCASTLTDTVARKMYYRDPSDWLRPIKE